MKWIGQHIYDLVARFRGGVYVESDLSITGNTIITGDLTVNGTTTTINTVNLDVKDNNITLNYSTGDSSSTADGAGITIQDAVNSTTNSTILWDATNDKFDFSHGATFTGAITIGNTYNTSYKNDGFIFTDNQDYNIKSGNEKILDLHFNEIKFYSGNTERMRLNSTGLGIGLTNPSEKLNVNGNIRVEDEGEIYIQGGTSTRKIVRLDNTGDKGLITLNRGDETKVSISSDFNGHGHTYFNGLNTNVGIGTASPGYLLTVDSSNSSGPDNVAFFNSASNNERILIGSANQYIEHKGSEQRITLASEGSAGTFTVRTNGSERMRLTSDGKLGISETTPEGLLHVYNPNDSGTIRTSVFEHRYGVNSLSQYARYGIIVKSADVTPSLGITNQTYNSVIQSFLYASPFTAKDIALQTLGGSVLVGLNATSGATHAKLVVKTDGSLNAQSWYSNNNLRAYVNASGDFYSNRFRAMAGSQSYPPISFDSANKWGLWYSSGLNIITNQNIAATFTSDGKLGIGTTSPSEKLEVYGGNLIVNNGTSKSRLRPTDLYMQHSGTIKAWLRADGNSYFNGGNLGINTSSPTEKLHVVGDALITGDSHADAFKPAVSGNPIKFKNFGSTELARITDGGYVGIGTSSPSSALDVIGNADVGVIQVSHTTNGCYGSILFGTISRLIGDCGTWTFKNTNTNTNQLCINDTGVGIGTTSPDSLLEISSDSVTDFLKLTSAGGGANPIKLIFEKSSVEQGIIEYNRNGDLEIYNSDNDGGVMIDGSASTGADFYVANSGNVGIGTDSPATKLHLATSTSGGLPSFIIQDNARSGSAALNYISLTDSANATHAKIGYLSGLNTEFTLQNLVGNLSVVSSNQININSGSGAVFLSSSSEKMRLTVDGKLGIGTSSPSSTLHINNTSGFSIDSERGIQDGGRNGWAHYYGAGNAHILGKALILEGTLRITPSTPSATTTSWRFQNVSNVLKLAKEVGGTTTTDNVFTVSNTNIGIGTASPSEKLHVVGDVKIEGANPYITLTDTTNPNYCEIKNIDGNLDLYADKGADFGNSRIRLHLDGTEKMTLSNIGLGIGTTSPTQLLHIDNPTGASSILLEGASGYNSQVLFRTNPASAGGWLNYDYSANVMTFGTNASERLRLTSNGNVLIGTTTDSGDKLEVAGTYGNTRFVGHAIRFTRASANYLWAGTSGGDLRFTVNGNGIGSPSMMLSTAGNLLIGTTTDSGNKLQIETSNNNDGFRLNYPSNNSTQYPFYIGKSDDSNYIRVNANIIALKRNGATSTIKSEGSSNDLTLQSQRHLIFNTSDANEKARITSGGNFGINESNPTNKLEVFGGGNYGLLVNTTSSVLELNPKANGYGNIGSSSLSWWEVWAKRLRYSGNIEVFATSLDVSGNFSATGSLTLESTTPTLIFTDTNSDPDYSIKVNGGIFNIRDHTNDVARLSIKSNGNVGIGTSSPNRQLQVQKTTGTASIAITSSNTGTAQLELGGTSDNDIAGVAYSGNTSMLSLKTNNTGQLYVTSGGNVLIGTTTDSGAKATIAGQAALLGNGFYGLLNLSGTNALADYNTANKIVMHSNGSTDGLYTGGLHLTRRTFSQQGDYGSGIRGLSVGTVLQDNALELYTSTNTEKNATRLKITSTGNVGIGTSSPQRKLHLHESSGSVYLQMTQGSTGTTSNDGFQIAMGATQVNLINRENGPMLFDTNNSTKMSLLANGNLLIGTTTDDGSSKLQVDGDVKFFGATTNRDLIWKQAQDALILKDSAELRIGTGYDLRLYHDGSNSRIRNNNGDLYISQNSDDKNIIFTCDDGVGNTTEYFRLDGSVTRTKFAKPTQHADDIYAYFGNSDDLRIFHSSGGNIANHTNDLRIQNWADNKDIRFECDNGTGGLTDYIRLDGSQETVNFYKTVLIGTTTNTGAYKIDVAGKQRVQDTLELDDVLMLNAISTPSDPAAGKSVIYMDSADGGIKCKINVSGTVVTRTLAAFEG